MRRMTLRRLVDQGHTKAARLRALGARVLTGLLFRRQRRPQGGHCAGRRVLGVVMMTVGLGVNQGGPGAAIPA